MITSHVRTVLCVVLCFCFFSVTSQTVETFAGNGIDSLVNGKGTNTSFGKCFGIESDKKGLLLKS